METPKKVREKQSQDKQNRVIEIEENFNNCLSKRSESYFLFDDHTFEEYINESVRLWNSYLPPVDDDNWRSNVFMPETRNKTIAILSFVAGQRMRVEISARKRDKAPDKVLSGVVKSSYDYSLDHEGGDKKFFLEALECSTKGTVIVFEGYNYRTRKIRQFKDYDFATGEYKQKVEKEIIEEDDCFKKVIPLEDLYIPNFFEEDIQKQSYLIYREEVDYQTFKSRFGKYKDFDKVPYTNNQIADKDGKYDYYQRYWERIKNGNVEILTQYNKEKDQVDISANGILLTPLDNPFIWDHKQYPFGKAVFEPMTTDFFYGKSLPQKFISEQIVLNTMYNMFLDRTYLSVMPWFITSLVDEIEMNEIRPMGRIQVSDPDKMREAQIKPVGTGEFNMLQTVLDSISKSSIDVSQQGQVSSDTATGIMQARESSVRMMGLFLNSLAWMEYELARLRISNILQFYPKPNSLKTGTIREIQEENQILSDGTKGLKIIRLMKDSDLSPELGRNIQTEVNESETSMEITPITSKMLKDIDYKLKIVPNSSVPETKSLRKALALEYTDVVLQRFPDLSNREKLFDYINEVFDQNTEEMKVQAPQAPQNMPSEAPQGSQTQGMGKIASQMLGGQKSANLKALATNMPQV